MDNPAALAFLKTDLGFLGTCPPGVEDFLRGKLDQAAARIAKDGITLDLTDPADLQFLASFAAYLYRKRDAGSGVPPMLRDELHDRQVARSTGGAP